MNNELIHENNGKNDKNPVAEKEEKKSRYVL